MLGGAQNNQGAENEAGSMFGNDANTQGTSFAAQPPPHQPLMGRRASPRVDDFASQQQPPQEQWQQQQPQQQWQQQQQQNEVV